MMSNMREISKIFQSKISFVDRLLIFLIFPFPLYLATSIFIADFFCAIVSLVIIYLSFKDENKKYFKPIKKEIIFFLILYLIILINFAFSDFKEQSFLSSVFYFRYFLLSLTIFYLLKKFENLHLSFVIITFGSFLFVIFDAYIQKIIGINLFGYEVVTNYGFIYLTGFFNEEKKLGSYLIRLLPLLLGLIYFTKLNKFKYFNLLLVILTGFVIFNSSERVALFLFFVFLFFFIITNKNKILISSILTFFLIILFTLSEGLKYKFLNVTLSQLEILEYDGVKKKPEEMKLRYFSKEHEDLVYTAWHLFKNSKLIGGGVKTFYQQCEILKKSNKIIQKNSRNNLITCSTHPHNTYLQILSELGIFGFFLISYFFFYFLLLKSKLFFKYKLMNKDYLSLYFITISLFISLFPFIPSGNIFNNWISLMIYFPLGFWIYFKNKIFSNELLK